MGGAKFNTKINLIEVLDKKADHIFIGGALSNDIYRARGLHIGNSKVSEIDESVIKKFMNLEKVSVPVDVEVLNKEKKNTVKPANNIKEDETIVDGGPETFKILEKQINSAKMIIWNGPFGLYEDGYDFLTRKVAKAIGKSSAFSIVGGGDTLTEISRRGNHDDYDFVSLGGGAMLEFISNGTLVGIEAIENGF